MDTASWIIAAFLSIFALYVFFRLGAGMWLYRRYHGEHLITCPENQKPAGVHLDASYTVLTGFLGVPTLRLDNCSRWPEMHDCGQDCLAEIQRAPEQCMVKSVLTAWYRGKDCVLCGRPLHDLDWAQHNPGLRSPEGLTYGWGEVPTEKLPLVLSTHQPVCWNCHVSERFRREHPELVTERNHKRPVA